MGPVRRFLQAVTFGGQVQAAAFVVPAAMAAIYGWLIYLTTFHHPGLIGPNYDTVGSDWMAYFGALQGYLSGHLSSIYNGDWLTDFVNRQFGTWLHAPLPYRPWVYPPNYLLMLLPFGALDFPASYAAFQIATAAALIAAIIAGRGNDRIAWTIAICALVCPAASVNAVDGQNAFLCAALLVGGYRLLGDRPVVAGVLFGLATFKPQFALLVPVALIAAGEWQALASFAATAVALVAASAFVFGTESWIAWIHLTAASLVHPDAKWVEYGRIWGNSVWTCAMTLGASQTVASALQYAALLFSAAAVAWAFLRRLDCRLAVLLAATVLAAPHWSPYDAVLLAIAGVSWVARRPPSSAAWPWLLVLALWLVPLMSPPLLIPTGRFVPLLLILFLTVVMQLDPRRIPD